MGMDKLLNDIALVDAVTRRFVSLGYNMDDALKAASVAILTGKPILVTRRSNKPTELTNNNENTQNPQNPRFG